MGECRKWLALATAAVVALVAFGSISAASAESPAPTTAPLLTYGITFSVSSLNPALAGTQAQYVDPFSLEFLMKVGPHGQVLPNLAQSVSHPTPAIYDYHLRHGVKFWDGTEMTSADVVNAINYQRYPTLATAVTFDNVKTVKALDPFTVRVILKHPDASWPYIFTYAGFIWEQKFQLEHNTTFGQPGTLVMGTGPYIPQSLDPTSGEELNANPNYWGGKVPIQHISIKFFSDEQSEALAFRAGDIDVAFPSAPATFAATANTQVIARGTGIQGFFSMNSQEAPFNDIHVRRAIAYAINRSDVVTAEGGYAQPDSTMIPPVQLESIATPAQVSALVKSLPTYQFDLTKAKQELAESAYPQGFTTQLYTFNFANFVNTAQAIAGDLAKIGITLNINVLSTAAYSLRIRTLGFEPTGYTTLLGNVTSDPNFVPNLIYNSKNTPGQGNRANYQNPEMDSLRQQAIETSNPAKRFALYAKLLKLIQPLALYVPLYEGDTCIAIDSKFAFPTFNGLTSNRTAWILNVVPK